MPTARSPRVPLAARAPPTAADQALSPTRVGGDSSLGIS